MDNLLDPISAAAPCGIDLAYDAVYNDLAVLMEGTPENQFEPGSGKEPNWAAIRKLAEESLKRSKDLQIAIYFTVALSQTAGMEGAARGLELIAGIVRKYWDDLFPNLDPDDKDPTQRVNILSQLTVEPGGYGDPIKFIARLSQATIFRAPGAAVTMAFLLPDGNQAVAAGKLKEVLAAAGPEEAGPGVEALRRVVAAVHSLDDYLIEVLGRQTAPSFEPLIKVVDKTLRLFDGMTDPEGAAATADAGVSAVGSSGHGTGAGPAISGEIRSQDDVLKMLAKIRAYYAANEPSSPVPLLLQRVERLVGRDFLTLITNLTPGARSELEVLLGPQPDDETP
jgi:type VI secretion system protein ImpA